MAVLRRSTSGISGGGGARYKCPNSPHPKCPKCKGAMHRDFYYTQGDLIRYRDDKWHCRPCENKEKIRQKEMAKQ